VVVDATGSVDVLRDCLTFLGIGGTLFVYGMTEEAAQLVVSPYDIFRRELVIKGSFSQGFSFDRAITLLGSGRLSTEGLVTHRFGLPDYGRAIDAVAHDSSCIKAVIAP
jgi:D-arabinitol dehydrogenase (NADP+)